MFLLNNFGRSECKYSIDNPVPNPVPSYAGGWIEIGPNWVYHLSYCKPDQEVYPDQSRQPYYYLHVSAFYNVHAQIGMEQDRGDIRCAYGFKPQNMNPDHAGNPQPMSWVSRGWSANIGDNNINGNSIKEWCRRIFNENNPIIT